MSDIRFKIVRGSDKTMFIRLTSAKSGAPKDLSSAVAIEVVLNKSNGKTLSLTNINLPATNAQLTVNSVLYTATVAGASGNLIKLVGNGVKTVSQVISDWNGLNPSNQVSSNASPTQLAEIFSTGEFTLTGGYLAYSPVSLYGNPLLGMIQVTILEKETQGLKLGSSQSFSVKIDDGVNPSGLRYIGIFENKLDVVDPV